MGPSINGKQLSRPKTAAEHPHSQAKRIAEERAHLVLVYGQRLLLQDEPLRPPQPADDAILLDSDQAAPDDMGTADHVRVAVGGATDARVRGGVGGAGGRRSADGEGGGVPGAGQHVLDIVAASHRCRGCRTRGCEGRGGYLVVRHG